MNLENLMLWLTCYRSLSIVIRLLSVRYATFAEYTCQQLVQKISEKLSCKMIILKILWIVLKTKKKAETSVIGLIRGFWWTEMFFNGMIMNQTVRKRKWSIQYKKDKTFWNFIITALQPGVKQELTTELLSNAIWYARVYTFSEYVKKCMKL